MKKLVMKLRQERVWPDREKADFGKHLAACQPCREKPILEDSEKIFGVKNSKTREYLHVVVCEEREVARRLGWDESDIAYTTLTRRDV